MPYPEIVYYFRNTSIFLMLSKFYDKIIIKDINSRGKLLSTHITNIYSCIYIWKIINNITCTNLINAEIDFFKKIIDISHMINYKPAIILLFKCLLYFKNKFNVSNKEPQYNFCSTLLKYMMYDLNLMETIEYKEDFEMLQSKQIPTYSSLFEMVKNI